MKPGRNDIHVDPVLTKIAVDYQNMDYVHPLIMPSVDVKKKAGIYFVYDKSKFRPVDSVRAPGTRANRVDYGLVQATYGPLVEHALEDDVPDEIADEYPDELDAYADAVENIREREMLNQEVALATTLANIAVVTQNVTLSGTDRWDDYANSDPISDIETARNTVRQGILKRPNTLLLSDPVYAKLRHHPQLLERFKYSERGILTKDHLAALFEVDRVIVAAAMYNTADEGQDDSMADIWGKHAWLFYIEPRPQRKRVSFGYTLRMQNLQVERWYQQPEKSTFVRVSQNYEQKIVAAEAAYLLKNAVA